ncbi:hypothetical protein BC936DRAFT_145270 [Jimgerdemannia flammicorona]|uniref:UV-stimulated scaffold protein A n=1 Tax=Jimgerdemannia flammicorona TaxID=994334 RepID=A0A433DAE9_9FUNG|nr:hypothetical protein BC936DRAFT_145270 [Jimgerdemannia flammicorona]
MSTPEHKALANLIVSLTTTGEWILNNQKLKELKSLCKKSDSIVENAYRLTWAQLEKNHAQIRYSSLQLVEQLFSRSHHFRQLLAADYPSFLQLTVGIHRKTLPPPENVAAKLAEYGTTLVKQWYEKFGDTYKPLTLGYQYLKNNMRVNFADLSLASYTTRAREQEQREAALKISRQRKFEKIRADFDGQINDIQENLRNMETCFEILVPKPDENINLDFDSLLRGVSGADPAAVGATSGSLKNTIATHGLGSSRYRLTIHLSAENPMDVSETADNEAVYENLREYYGVLTKKHVDVVAGWLDGLMKSESEHSEARDSMLKKVIDLKNALRVAKNKSELVGLKSNRNDDNDDDEGIEFEEVPIPANAGEGPSRSSKQHGSAAAGGDREKRLGSTTTSSKQLPPAHRVFPLAFEPEMEEDVTYARPKLYVSHAEREDGEVEISVGESTRTLQALADRKGKTKEPVRKIVSSREGRPCPILKRPA